MKLNRDEYLDKVKACFIGKNIGGTIGGPTEGKEEILDVQGFSTEKGKSLPNDDLDLQLIWLYCLEQEGPKHVNPRTLSYYWQSFLDGYWSEYGISKRNLQKGLPAPLSGDFENAWKDSNGAWIRTEIWACLSPLAVDTAVKYSLQDAMLDHGMGEGTYAAAFVAALESAAFGEKDIHKLIEIGLSKVPEDCRLASSVKTALSLYESGIDWKEARNKIVAMNADIRNGCFQAPSNVAFVILGLLYGEGDYKKSMLTAINCGDDTDCTGATIGSIMGLLYGTEGIPEDWKEYIGDKIETISLNKTIAFPFPQGIEDLEERIAFQAPYLLKYNKEDVEFVEEETEIPMDYAEKVSHPFGKDDERDTFRDLSFSFKPNTFPVDLGRIEAIVTYVGGPTLEPLEEKEIKILLLNHIKAFGNMNLGVSLSLMLPEGYVGKKTSAVVDAPCWTLQSKMAASEETALSFLAPASVKPQETLLLRVEVLGFGEVHFVPVTFLAK